MQWIQLAGGGGGGGGAPYHIDFFLSAYIQQHITLINSVWAMIRSQYSGSEENFEILNHNGVSFTLHLQMML